MNYQFIKNKNSEKYRIFNILNKLKTNKKGLDFAVLLALVVVPLALLFLFSQLNEIKGENKNIGLTQLKLLETAQESENILFYIDQSAKNSVDQSLYLFGQRGGFFQETGCGRYKIHSIWETKDKKCYPELVLNFKLLFEKELNNYLTNYPEENIFSDDNYFLTIKEDKIIGEPIKDISLDIINQNNDKIGSYLFVPSFAIDANFDDFQESVNEAKSIFNWCKDVENIRECIEAQIYFKGLSRKWSIEFENDFALFDVTSNKEVWIYTLQGLLKRKVHINFAYFLKNEEDLPNTIEKDWKDISITTYYIPEEAFEKIKFGFSRETPIPNDNEIKGNIYLKDVYDIAKELDVNYKVILGLLGTESDFGIYLNKAYDGRAHGAMQMFHEAVKDIYPDLIKKYPSLKEYKISFNEYNTSYFYNEISTSKEREHINMQIYAGALYFKKTREYLRNSGKPDNVLIVIRAYHDGWSYITEEGKSTMDTEEARLYTGSVFEKGEIPLT
ncbi:hypothetical protein CEE44_02450 [Candidatus Woesearchaeota archaeon B3_Woes]|nr:MAG: hypothetical protein CEE44_02450 [Candidatus Woesearchaeota archaeon B3_Woes]